MCDIKINDVSELCTMSILEAFGATGGEARSYFRTIQCFSIPPGLISDRVQLVSGSDLTSKYCMIITQKVTQTPQLSEVLHSGDFLCVPKAHIKFLESTNNEFVEFVCEITGMGSDSWALIRKATDRHPAYAVRKAVFASKHGFPFLNNLEKLESVSLEPAAVAHFSKRNKVLRFDAIVIENPGKSVITT